MSDKLIHIKISKREKNILIITIGIIAAGLLYNFIFEHLFKKWEYLNSEIIAKSSKFNREIRLLEKRNSIIMEYNSYAKSYKNISRVLSYIENSADTLGIKTSNIKPGRAIEKEFYQEYFIELQIEGQFPKIINFLSELIKLPCFVTVRRLDLGKTQESIYLLKGTIILSKIII